MINFNYSNDDAIKKYFNSINGYELLTEEEERQIAIAKSMGDEASKERLVLSNLRLVVKIAKNYTNLEPSLIDLIQEGNIGLMKAAEKFDYKIGCRFSTYASYWIKHYITRFIAKKSRTIRVPIRKGDLFKKIKKTQVDLFQKLGHQPAPSDIAEVLDIDEHSVLEILNVFQSTVSLEYPLNDSDFSLMEIICDNKSGLPEKGVYCKELKDELREALDSLMDNEKEILRRRFGFDDERPITLKEVGDEFGISAETVRQIETRAMDKIKKQYNHLNIYLD